MKRRTRGYQIGEASARSGAGAPNRSAAASSGVALLARLRSLRPGFFLLASSFTLLPACVIPVQPRGAGQPSSYGAGGGGGEPGASYGSPAPSPAGGGGSAAAAPAAPRPVSVTIRSSCRQTVRVFYGDKPRFGSGTYSTISSNSVSSHSFMPGDLFWIVDASDNGLSSTCVGEGTREIEILESCTGFRVR